MRDRTLEELRTTAAERYPREWAAAMSLTGKRRQNRTRALRDRVIYEDRMAALPAGASCGSCSQFRHRQSVGTVCDLHSDRDGYELRRAEEICPSWIAATKEAADV